jgi:ZIP family zinc transporter
VEAGTSTAGRGMAWRLWALVPILLLAVVVGAFASSGDRLLELVGQSPPPADELDIRRVELRPGEIRVLVRNPQRDAITIAVATVDDAIVPFTTDGPAELGRLRSTTVVIPFLWVEGEPLTVGLTSSTGIQTTAAVAAAVETPTPSARGFLGYGLVGLLVGVVPVALGLLWLPSLRRLDARWLGGFLALTCGLLTFLGVEALFEAFELQAGLPGALGGPGLVLLGVALATLGMTLVSSRLGRGSGATGLALALLVAIGIGVHNLGEGLAIGTSFALGELQLGTFFVIGFMVHNLTEGLGIAAPAARERVSFAQLAGLALVAGAPAILGTWIGGYGSSDLLTPVFFALAAGAALQVVVEVARHVARTAPGGLRSGWAVGGYLAGIAAMWATGLLVG